MTKTLHIFTEEPSAKKLFDSILPKLLPPDVQFRVYSHQGKQDLEKALKNTLPSISRTYGARILVIRDQDSAECIDVKKAIKSKIGNSCTCQFFIRIACRELEAWYLGDLDAIKNAYPRLRPENYSGKADLRNVDEIMNPAEYLLKIIPEYSSRHFLPKIEVSESIAPFLNFENNTSVSFNQTISAIRKLASE